MAKKENFHPYSTGTEHGRLSFGKIRRNNEISACMLESGPDGGRHYITMDSTGNKEEGMKGSTKSFCPGTLTVKSGKDIVNFNKGSNKPNNIPAILCEAENGDIILSAPHGKIKLQADAIELIADGSDNRKGVISLTSDEKVIIDSQIVDIQSKVSTKIFSENTVHLIGKSLLNIYGGLADFADGTTKHRRSKLSEDDSVLSQNEVRNAT
mgnify:CR=1 FL=1